MRFLAETRLVRKFRNRLGCLFEAHAVTRLHGYVTHHVAAVSVYAEFTAVSREGFDP